MWNIRPASDGSSPKYSITHHFASLCLVFVVGICSVGYGLSTTANATLVASRSDVTELYLSLGPTLALYLPKLMFASFTCLSPGEFCLSLVLLITAGRVERVIGTLRMFQAVFALLIARAVWVPVWCVVLDSGLSSPSSVLIRPSALWLCVSLSTVRLCLIRSSAHLQLWGVIPVNHNILQHAVVLHLIWLQLPSMLDTVVPAVLCGLALCTPLVGIHRWTLGSHAWDRNVVPQLKKCWKALPPPGSASWVRAAASPAPAAPGGTRGSHRPSTANHPRSRNPAPAEDFTVSLSLLLDMGFGEEESRRALRVSRGDINEAARILLEGGGA